MIPPTRQSRFRDNKIVNARLHALHFLLRSLSTFSLSHLSACSPHLYVRALGFLHVHVYADGSHWRVRLDTVRIGSNMYFAVFPALSKHASAAMLQIAGTQASQSSPVSQQYSPASQTLPASLNRFWTGAPRSATGRDKHSASRRQHGGPSLNSRSYVCLFFSRPLVCAKKRRSWL